MWFGKKDEEHWQRYDNLKMHFKKEMEDSLNALRIELEAKNKPIPRDAQDRIAELEIKMAKLWGLLLEQHNGTKKDKLTKFGRMFGGAAKDHL